MSFYSSLGIRKSMISRSFNDLKKDVIDTGLCTHCGLCTEVCPVDAIGISGHLEGRFPVLAGDCCECGMCYQTCPGYGIDFEQFRDLSVFEGDASSDYLGRYRSIYLGYAKSDIVREHASSGGVVTALLLYLLDLGEIDGCVVVGPEPDRPWLFQTKIAETPVAILRNTW
jgi:coenzyme F420 hydrogenase subunit beta